MISFEKIKGLLPSGFKLILDEEYKLPTDTEVLESVRKFVSNRHFLAKLKQLLDGNYIPYSYDVNKIVEEYYGEEKPFEYTRNLHDCDNAAWELVAWVSGRGWPVGIAVVPGHALVIYINDKLEVKYIDQYTGKITENKERLKVTVIP